MAGSQKACGEPLTQEQRQALDDVFSLVYEELRRLAASVRKIDFKATLNSTALVHEAWLKLKDSPHLAALPPLHFKATAARAMRQVLVDEARRRSARKRGGAGEAVSISLTGFSEPFVSCDQEFLATDAALEELTRLSPRQAQIVEARFFGGLSVSETAALLSVSESVIERDWRAAKAWLASRIRPGAR